MTDSPPPFPQDETAIRGSGFGNSDSRERFTPGTLLADRFRIIAPLGRGGMGEVYRADDIRLGQPVALKFLPASLERDRERLERLHAEVRVGRQVSHPNVCRLYDIGEFQGTHFIAMEFIDGEDLASLLRRIGKLPHGKALDLTRDICAGLAAAHSLGVLHRDLKPANVMIDGRGRARVTDFGLAALESEAAARNEIAGTPDYMPPEVARGEAPTQRADLFSLGAILYEMFTGRRAADRKAATTISQHTRELEPAVQRVILRCLDPNPANRPASIHAVIAALPGGDPLQAALDAGETPSPEMIAAAGATGELPARVAIPLLVLTLVLIFGTFALIDRTRLTSLARIPKTPAALADRAEELVRQVGYREKPADTWYRFFSNSGEAGRWLRNRVPDPVQRVATLRPSVVALLYRESPRRMIPERLVRVGNSPAGVKLTAEDPPLIVPGMVRVVLDSEGRLTHFAAVPPARSEGAAPRVAVNWQPLLTAAAMRPDSLRSVAPEWSAPVDNDAKAAWMGEIIGQPGVPIRVEAASHRGLPVYFRVITPWTEPLTPRAAPTPTILAVRSFAFATVFSGALVAAIVLARANVRRGRADRRGAARLATFILAGGVVFRLLISRHYGDVATELNSVILPLVADALFPAATVWLFYLALEPYLRRRWPHTLIGWNRLLAGSAADPLVGRDLLTGVIAGSLMAIASAVVSIVSQQPPTPVMVALGDMVRTVALTIDQIVMWPRYALGLCVVLLLTHVLLRNRAAAVVATFVVFALIWFSPAQSVAVDVAYKAVISAIVMAALLKSGLLACATAMSIHGLIVTSSTTLDTSRWFFAHGAITAIVLIALAGYGFFRSLGTQPLFAGAVLDD